MRKKNGQFGKGDHWRGKKPWWDYEWLFNEYVTLSRSAGDIAKEYNIGDTAIHYWLKKHGIKTRNVSEARKIKHWGQEGIDNPMWNKKGELNQNWKGGITPERQAFYISREWKDVCRKVWGRDKGICKRCRLDKNKNKDMPFHIHHIVSFKDKELRADPDNLILLCEACHHFVHSKRNIENEYLPKR